ncbi:MAG: hypothetical protein INQ03_22820 [Candidatus Heimdallarchaeota archaeon]|nr:hypothetical protein [Candidatus Heimdallarchaeota archaeon]
MNFWDSTYFMDSVKIRQKIIDELKEIAMEDGIESEEESEIINQVINDLELFKEVLALAMEVNKITMDEQMRLHKIIYKIDHNAHVTAEADGIISEDEMKLLYEICYQVGELDEYVQQLANEKNEHPE